MMVSNKATKSVSIHYEDKLFTAVGKTVGDIKLYILECEGIPVRKQTLMYNGNILIDDGMAPVEHLSYVYR